MVNNIDWWLRYSSKECLIYKHNSHLTNVVLFDDDVTKLCLYNYEGTIMTVYFNTPLKLTQFTIILQANFLWKITFNTLYTNKFLIRIHSRALSISLEHNTI